MPFGTWTRITILAVLLFVVAGCGVTGDDDATSTTSSTSTTEAERSTTTTTEAEEPSTTTTTASSDGDLAENDPELEGLLLEPDEFGEDVTVDDDESEPFETEACDGQEYTAIPQSQASIGVTSEDLSIFAGEAIAQFASEDDASTFLSEVADLNAACAAQGDDNALPATFEPASGIGDEAITAVPDPNSEFANYEMVIARTGDRAVLLFALGEEPVLTNELVATAVDRAAG